MTSRASRLALTLLAAAVITAGSAAVPASAALAPWTPPMDVSAPGNAYSPQLAVAADGTVTAVWSQADGGDGILYGSHYADATWSAPVAVSLPGGDSYGAAIVARPDGSAVAVWQRQTGFFLASVQASIFNGTSWSAPVDLTDPASFAYDIDLAVQPDGRVTAIWAFDTGSFGVTAQTSTLSGSVWSSNVGVHVDDHIAETEIEVASDGTLVAIWSRGISPDRGIFASTWSAGAWSPAEQVSVPGAGGVGTGPDYYQPHLAAGQNGTMTAVWSAQFSGSQVYSSTFLGRVWSTPVVISGPGASSAQIAASPTGDFAAVWLGSTNRVEASTFSGASWSAPVALSTDGEFADEPQVVRTPSGFVAIWDETTATTSVVGVSEFTGGVWSAPVHISDPAVSTADAHVAVDRAGTLTAVWAGSDFVNSRIQSARYVVPATAAALAATGSDPAPGAAASALLLLAGALLVLGRRRPISN